ncbi:helix-turn-helix domain-containing protein [Burkholderia vietnamiensis]|uniref:helix-turn-helix domain-containing protein n=1 Tax=Burkholderia vietnamiensis TaxID=60552 RepID=UPI001BA2D92C|nr:helix-turn-helix domain-containing protein [Burkholderia vietnamiensis]MBR8161999.1 helix-turn-helix domain-containing protein [Burkholderia vietnamiensis]HDR9026799.1 helix-turn-helix domain-containing protein [Burkholderia vietnamiensis]
MSLHHENLAWEIELPSVKKIVLLAIARAAHLNNRECCPTVQHLAFKCGLSESAVRASIESLVELGLIETMKVPGKGRVYRVLLGVEVTA